MPVPVPPVDLVLVARSAELPGGLPVLRAMPQRQRRIVGPFVFVDQMGPAPCPPGREVTVLSHPHIGLSTVTYLFEGEGLHRDSLGTVQPIRPGEVNWMTAGAGIAHSERIRSSASGRVFGMQLWVALPRRLEESPATFEHYDASSAATFEEGGVAVRVIAGSLLGAASAVRTDSPLFYADVKLGAGAVLRLPPEHEERAAFLVEGSTSAAGTTLREGEIAFFQRGVEVPLRAEAPARLLLFGGEPLDGPRYISWNFVSSSKERLQQAASDWRHQRFARIPGETAYIPLPEDGHAPVDYP
jgi:redox-sensitive bicupin YhaK (pirin superfamily)